MLVMVFIVGSYMTSSSMTSCTPVVRNKMEVYTIKASIKQAFRQNYTEERRVGDYAAAKYLYSCLLARLAVECYAQRRQLPLHDADFHNGLLTHVRGGQPGQAYAAIVQSLDTLPMWRETTTQDLVAQLKGRLALLGVSTSLRKWFTRYANSVKLWLARTVTTYRDRLQGTLARLEEALAGVSVIVWELITHSHTPPIR
ncbi:hypothetical protein J8273_2006 [Carpediemonas membranifera]|uniref:HEPN domain-containing protein n=1 Tax=Carpediemonas membranifera TaxID=201153 RepID=A0A8J6AZT8_9EUKA|nr:hypothetical protein J8273_2006 [Carpediemonas membranifera]|eukprot:KAG9396275.1 hypothetical protein J8273_2006 [Carpediemonas membranifera]